MIFQYAFIIPTTHRGCPGLNDVPNCQILFEELRPSSTEDSSSEIQIGQVRSKLRVFAIHRFADLVTAREIMRQRGPIPTLKGS